MSIPTDLRYSKDHEWAKQEGSNIVMGITSYAQDQLGDVVFLELPEVGKNFKKGDACAVVESVKAASDIYMAVSGKVAERNEAAVNSPELLNQDPFGKGWLVKITPLDMKEFDELMSADQYGKLVGELTK